MLIKRSQMIEDNWEAEIPDEEVFSEPKEVEEESEEDDGHTES